MKAILDTHTFLWAISEKEKLSAKAQNIYTGDHDLFLSVGSIWEALIKVQSGKLPLPQPTGPYLVRELRKNRIEVLPVKLDHVLKIETLPVYHRDPFDRILIAQSLTEGLPLITSDPLFKRYQVEVIW
jgi:PIN domain nuclease of toxin-antitoxin system